MKLISIEGLDGAGKTTAVEVVKEKFPDAKVLREPGGTALSELLRLVLKAEPYANQKVEICDKAKLILETAYSNTENRSLRSFINDLINQEDLTTVTGELTATDELFLFNAARAQLFEEVINSVDGVLILDRFIDSTVAYQGYGRGLDPDYVKKICLQASGGALPEQTFYLKIAPETRLKRIGGRGDEDRIEASGNSFFEKIADGFETIISEDTTGRFIIIDAEQAPEAVAADICEQLA